MRKIIHVDMDAFYASVEQRDFPEFRGKPIVVGGSSSRGVVAAASYEARAFGVRSALPSVQAKRLCPNIIFVRPRFNVYRDVSHEIRNIFLSYTDLVEPLSLDEAYLDVTKPKKGPPSGLIIARLIKADILRVTGLTASAGVSINKSLAKIASAMNKPDGLTCINPDEARAFIATLPIGRIQGVGRVTEARMHEHGIYTGADLQASSEAVLTQWFGKAGRYFYRIAQATENSPVRPHRERKSVGAERTFETNIQDKETLLSRLQTIAEHVARRLEKTGLAGRTITLKIKYRDFRITTRSHTLDYPISTSEDLFEIGSRLLHIPALPEKPVRLLGLSVAKLYKLPPDELPMQLSLGL